MTLIGSRALPVVVKLNLLVVPLYFVIPKILLPFLSSLRSERSAPKETVHSAREQRYFAFGTWVAMADSIRRRGLR